jgi:alpha-L-fucosidase
MEYTMFCRFAWLLLAITVCLPVSAQAPRAAKDGHRMDWWREAKFGMFIHWGVYSVPAGIYRDKEVVAKSNALGEWIMRNAEIPVDEYQGFARQFNPVKYQPEEWAALAKRAGMRYVVITAKHHDGFAMYDSAATNWDIVDATPYGKDVIAPLASAIRDQGLKFGLYYSQAQDWVHPGGGKSKLEEGEGWDESHKGSFDDYLRQIAAPQTRELLTRYRPDIFWWDTPQWMNKKRAEPLHELLALQPEVISNNRLGGGFKGDTETPEQHIPDTGIKDRDWEVCMTMNGTWGYKSCDHDWKSTDKLINMLIEVVSKGGNFLLNVGPMADGTIPQESVERLQEVGQWLEVNGESIYGASASPIPKPDWGRVTYKPREGFIYLHVLERPADGRLSVAHLPGRVSSAKLLGADLDLAISQENGSTSIQLPAADNNSLPQVVRLKLVEAELRN